MIARAGLFHFERGERSGLDLNAFAASPFRDSSPHDFHANARGPFVHHPFVLVFGFSLTGFGIAVLLAFLIAQMVSERELARRGRDGSRPP